MGCIASSDTLEENIEFNDNNKIEHNILYNYCCLLLVVITFLNMYYSMCTNQIYKLCNTYSDEYNVLKNGELVNDNRQISYIDVSSLNNFEFKNDGIFKNDNETISGLEFVSDIASVSDIESISDIASVSDVEITSIIEPNNYSLNRNIYIDCDKYSCSLLEQLITSYFQNDNDMTNDNTYIKIYGKWENGNDTIFHKIFNCDFTNIIKYDDNKTNVTKMMIDLMEDICLGSTEKVYLITNDCRFSNILEKIKYDYPHVDVVLPWRPYLSKKIKPYVTINK